MYFAFFSTSVSALTQAKMQFFYDGEFEFALFHFPGGYNMRVTIKQSTFHDLKNHDECYTAISNISEIVPSDLDI